MPAKYNSFDQSYRPDGAPQSSSKSVEVTLRCACGTEKKVTMKVSEGVAVGSKQNYSCAPCTEARRLERDRGRRIEAATAPRKSQEPLSAAADVEYEESY